MSDPRLFEDDPVDPGETTFTVGQLNRLIQAALAVTFPDDVWVEGEISSLKRHEASGNVYFQLVEAGPTGRADATIAITLNRRDKQVVNNTIIRGGDRIRMADGVHLRIRGSIDYYPAQGRLQLRMHQIDPTYTLGRLTEERDRVLAALAAESLIGRNRLLPFPRVPSHVGLITARGSAAEADFLDEFRLSGLRWRITYLPTAVQGTGSDQAIAAALVQLGAAGVEVIALVRGGGARTDLLAFDSEVVARAIATLPVPVVTGIGHEIDRSVADEVAADSFKTPTACAAGLIALARDAHERAESAWAGIRDRSRLAIEHGEHRMGTTGRRVSTRALARIAVADHHVDAGSQRLVRSASVGLSAADRVVDLAAVRAGALDPARTLARGWSITRRLDGTIVRSVDTVDIDDELLTTVTDGQIRSRATINPTETAP